MHIHDHSHGEGQPHQCGDAPSHGHSLQYHSPDLDHSHALGLGGQGGHAHPRMQPSVLAWAMAATLGLVVAEIFGGLLGHSIALLNDAVHNLSDVPALGISWLAMRWAQRPADAEKTYGYRRAGELAAFTNAVLLVLLSGWLGWESIERLRSPGGGGDSWMI